MSNSAAVESSEVTFRAAIHVAVERAKLIGQARECRSVAVLFDEVGDTATAAECRTMADDLMKRALGFLAGA